MSEIKRTAKVEIEFDVEQLETGWIEFELEGEEWIAVPTNRGLIGRARNYACIANAVQAEFGCTSELAWEMVSKAIDRRFS